MTTLEEISALTRPNHPDDWTDVDSLAVDTVRVLAADGGVLLTTAGMDAALPDTLFPAAAEGAPIRGEERWLPGGRCFRVAPAQAAFASIVGCDVGRGVETAGSST